MTATAIAEDPQEPRALPGKPFCIGDARLTTDRSTTQLREAREIQRLIYADCKRAEIKPVDLAALARAWCALQESIRVLRGIPLPGQFRPDEVKMKRGRRGDNLIELTKAGNFAEAVETPKAASQVQPAKP